MREPGDPGVSPEAFNCAVKTLVNERKAIKKRALWRWTTVLPRNESQRLAFFPAVAAACTRKGGKEGVGKRTTVGNERISMEES